MRTDTHFLYARKESEIIFLKISDAILQNSIARAIRRLELCACDVKHHTDETSEVTLKCSNVNDF